MKHGEGIDLLKCSKCKAVSYCSKECQLADWPAHKPMCQKHTELKTFVSETLGPEVFEAFEAWVKKITPLLTMAAAAALLPSRADTHVLILYFAQDPRQGSQVPTFSILPNYETITIGAANVRMTEVGGLFCGGPPPPAPPGRMLLVLKSDFTARVCALCMPPESQAEIQSGEVDLDLDSVIQMINSRLY